MSAIELIIRNESKFILEWPSICPHVESSALNMIIAALFCRCHSVDQRCRDANERFIRVGLDLRGLAQLVVVLVGLRIDPSFENHRC